MSENDGRPLELEVKDFCYKQLRKLRVFQSPKDLITARSSLLAISNQYGIVYVAGDNNCVKAIKVETVEKLFIEVQGSLQVEETNFASTGFDVGFPFSHIALSCDELTLAVSFKRDSSFLLGFIDVRAFYSTKSPKKLFCEVVLPLETPDAKVHQIAWNPTSSDIAAVLLSDGHLMMVKLNGTTATVIASLQCSATAVSWSPKGKQIVAGLQNGSLIQFTPELQKKKEIPTPTILQNPSQVSELYWISTYQFAAVYTECDDNDVSNLIIINSPKAGSPSFEVFDDVYYGMGEEREICFYINYLTQWKLLLSLYSGSYEVVTVNQSDEGPWVKWIPMDSGQAVLPTTHDNEETYPLGFGITFAVTRPINQDDQVFPPAPILFLLTTDGVLCPFYIMNKNPKAIKEICQPPKTLALDGERQASSNTAIAGIQKEPSSLTSHSSLVQASKTTAPISKDATKPPAVFNTQIATPKPPVPPENTNAPTASTLVTNPQPTALPPAIGSTKASGKNFPGFPTHPSASFSPVSIPPSMKPVISKSSPLNLQSAEAKPNIANETSAPVKAESVSKPAPTMVKPPDMAAVRTPPVPNVRHPGVPYQGMVNLQRNTVAPGAVVSKDGSQTKPSPSKQEQLAATFYKHIQNEVEAFNKEMEEARNRYNDLKELDVFLKEISNQEISKQVNNYRRFMNQVMSTIEDLKDDVNQEKSSFLDAFGLIEDAKTRDNTATDPRYLQLLKNRGLDPSSERKMKDIRSSYLLLDNTLREVNMALDEQWDKKNKNTRTLQAPSLDTIYQSMRQNRNIIKNQSLRLEAMSSRINNENFCKNKHRQALSVSESDDVINLSERFMKQKLNTTSKMPDNVSARKQSEIRQMLSKRSFVPVRKTTFISDWRSRKSSSESIEPGESSEAEETSVRDEKPAFPASQETQKKAGKQMELRTSKGSVATEQVKSSVLHSTPKYGVNDFPLSYKPTSLSKAAELKSLSPKTVLAKESLSKEENPPHPTQTSYTVSKAPLSTGSNTVLSPREAAAAAAVARASGGSSKLDLGASLPAKTLVEHKAKDGNKTAGKDANADHHARLIADAAVKDAENKMKSVTQPPPSNTASTFTARSSSSAAQSSGPPVMVLQPGGTFAIKKPGENPVLPATKPVVTAAKSVSRPETKVPQVPTGAKPPVGDSTSEKSTTSQNVGFTFTPSFGAQAMFGASVSSPSKGIPVFGSSTSGSIPVFSGGSHLFGATGPLSFGGKTQASVVQSPSREEATGGGGKQDDEPKTSKSLASTPASSSVGKESVARSLFDKPALDEDVPERGEPEGESKQPVATVTVQRQAAIGKSDKDSTPAASSKAQSPPTTSSKPLMVGFKSPFTTTPADFSSGDSKPGLAPFQPVTTQVSTSSIAKATTSSSPPDVVPSEVKPESQPAHRLGALGSGLSLTPPPFTAFTTVPSDPAAVSFTTTPPVKTTSDPSSQMAAPTPVKSVSEPTSSILQTTPTATPTATMTTATVGSKSNETTSNATPTGINSTVSTATASASTASNVQLVRTDLQPVSTGLQSASTGLPPVRTSLPSASTGFQPANTDLQPVQPASSTFSFAPAFGGTSATSSSPSLGSSTLNSSAPLFQVPPSMDEAPASGFKPTFGPATFGSSSQTTGFGASTVPAETKPASSFGGGFGGLGGKPIEPNRNPFEVTSSSQASDSGLFGSIAVSSTPNPFQSSGSKPTFGSTGFGANSGGVALTGFGTAPAAAPAFGSPPAFGSNPSFGAGPAFGASPTFGGAPTFGAAPAFGSPPTFGGAPTFGSGGGTAFGSSPPFVTTGSSPSRVFGAGTEAAGMFGNASSTPTFGSISNQSSSLPSFGGLAGAQSGMNQAPQSSMAGSSFSSYR